MFHNFISQIGELLTKIMNSYFKYCSYIDLLRNKDELGLNDGGCSFAGLKKHLGGPEAPK